MLTQRDKWILFLIMVIIGSIMAGCPPQVDASSPHYYTPYNCHRDFYRHYGFPEYGYYDGYQYRSPYVHYGYPWYEQPGRLYHYHDPWERYPGESPLWQGYYDYYNFDNPYCQ